MEMVKLVKGDRVIERSKVDYENNIDIWGIRGWKLDDGKPKAQPKVDVPVLNRNMMTAATTPTAGSITNIPQEQLDKYTSLFGKVV